MNKLLFSFCLVFSLIISAQGQLLLNGGFEETTTVDGVTTAAHWSIDPTGGKLVNDAHSGKSALSLWNWYVWVRGWACYGEGEMNTCKGNPASGFPVALTGWYKLIPGLNGGAADSAACFVTITNAPDGAGNTDTVSFVKAQLCPSESYRQFRVLIPYEDFPKPGFLVSVQFLSSERGNCGERSGGKCLYLTVDDLALEPMLLEEIGFLNLISDQVGWSGSQLRIDTDLDGVFPCTVVVTDQNGKEILKKTATKKGPVGDAISVPPANYTWKITTANGKIHNGTLRINN